MSELQDLGWANDWPWHAPPKVVKACVLKKHVRKRIALAGRCKDEVSCEQCGYRFRVDSSD